MQRTIISHTHTTQETIQGYTLHTYTIQWSGDNPPTTRVYKRLSNQGFGVVCYCPAHTYKRTCYHIKLARVYVQDRHTDPDPTPTKRDKQ